RRHVRSHLDATPRDRIMVVVAKREVVSVRKIQAAEMPIAAETEISDFDRVRPHVSDRRGPDQKAIAIKLDAATVVVVMKAALNRVALANEILAKDVGDVHVLVARVEPIQTA